MTEDGAAKSSDAPHSDHANHQALYHWVYVAGISILTGFVDFMFLWPETHLGAFLVLATWLSLVAIYEMTVSGYSRRQIGAAVAAVFLSGIIANQFFAPIPPPKAAEAAAQSVTQSPTINNIINNFAAPTPTPPPSAPPATLARPEVEVTGTILPADDAMPPNACERMGHPTDQTAIFLGTNVATRPEIGKFAILVRRGTPLVTIEKTADGIYIDASIFDPAGKLVGTVSNNKFTVLTGENTYVERRGDLSTFGVYDKSGTEFLYVRFLNPKAMRIRGIFYFQGLPIARITDAELQLGGIHASSSCFGGGNIMGFD